MKTTDRPIVIWGLRTSKHSHRYIHSGWYRTLKSAGFDVRWTDDWKSQASALTPGCTVFAVDVASKNLPIRPDCRYVLHHLSIEDRLPAGVVAPPVLNIKVWTDMSKGQPLQADLPCVLFDPSERMLYQPWGTPFPPEKWVDEPLSGRARNEYWIGSIWNDSLNQGNAPMIKEWRLALSRAGLRFVKAPRGWPDSPAAYGYLVRRSAIAGSVVGAWQERHQYLPCRTFKNLSFGAIPVGNNDAYQVLFGESAVVSHDLDVLIYEAKRAVTDRTRLRNAQDRMRQYTHLAALKRILNLLNQLD